MYEIPPHWIVAIAVAFVTFMITIGGAITAIWQNLNGRVAKTDKELADCHEKHEYRDRRDHEEVERNKRHHREQTAMNMKFVARVSRLESKIMTREECREDFGSMLDEKLQSVSAN